MDAPYRLSANAVAMLKHYDQLCNDRELYRGLWQEISDYILPKRGGITWRRSKGVKQTDYMFDSTATNSAELLAAAMHGSMTSSAIRWFHLEMRNAELNGVHEVEVWLEECTNRMHLAINQSNFAPEIQEGYLDFGAFGQFATYIEEKPPTKNRKFGGLLHKTLSPGEYVIGEDQDGNVDELWREFDMSARAIVQMFGMECCGPKVLEMSQQNPAQMFTVIHGVFPRFYQGQWSIQDTEESEGKPYLSAYVCKQDKYLMRIRGYRTFPYVVPRWSKTSGEVYGRGPGHTALPDVKTLNKLVEYDLKATAKAVDPTVMADEDAFMSGLDLGPGKINYKKRGSEVTAFEAGAKFNVTDSRIERLQSSIRFIFYSDHLRLKESPQMTAEEVKTRYLMMQRLMGPTLGRLESECFNRYVDRVFDLMYIYGALPQAPEIVVQNAQLDPTQGIIDVKYQGPLAKAQKSEDVDAIMSVVDFAAELETRIPGTGAIDTINIDEAMRHVSDIRGVPEKVMRSQEEVDAVRQGKAQVAAEKLQAEQDALRAKSARDVATAEATAPTPPAEEPDYEETGEETIQ